MLSNLVRNNAGSTYAVHSSDVFPILAGQNIYHIYICTAQQKIQLKKTKYMLCKMFGCRHPDTHGRRRMVVMGRWAGCTISFATADTVLHPSQHFFLCR